MNWKTLTYEARHQPLLGWRKFATRLGYHFLAALALIGVSLVGGMAGYHYLEHMSWIDAFANAAMILSGMGPLEPLHTWGGKLFAGWYALYSGLAVIVTMGILLSPVLHRTLHHFHLPPENES